MTADRFNDGYAAAEAHWKKRWYAANADHQEAVTDAESLRADLIRVNAEYHGLLSDVEAEREALAARLAAVEALLVCDCGELSCVREQIRAALSAAPTDTTKETSDE